MKSSIIIKILSCNYLYRNKKAEDFSSAFFIFKIYFMLLTLKLLPFLALVDKLHHNHLKFFHLK